MGLLYGIAAVALLWWLGRFFSKTNAAAMARAVKVVGGLLCFGGAALLGLRGRIDMALLLGGAGAWLLGWSVPFLPSWGSPKTQPTPGAVSRVRSALLEMELRHDTGDLSGRVLGGRFAGQALGGLDQSQLFAVMGECQASDPDGVRLLEAYLDRRFPGWREDAEPHPDPGPRGGPQSGAMTEKEAYEILGLQPGAGIEEIRAAHRALMKKFHPDQGGTPYLAAKINEAKEILLSRHR